MWHIPKGETYLSLKFQKHISFLRVFRGKTELKNDGERQIGGKIERWQGGSDDNMFRPRERVLFPPRFHISFFVFPFSHR